MFSTVSALLPHGALWTKALDILHKYKSSSHLSVYCEVSPLRERSHLWILQ